MNSANELLSCDREEKREMSENTEGKKVEKPNVEKAEPAAEQQGKPKKKLSWKERLAQLPEEEAQALRAKAAEASRISKAKKRGTTPEQAAVARLEARLAKIDTQLAELKTLKTELTAELKDAKSALAAAEKAQKEAGKAKEVDNGEA
jgi:chromosome segregation ATPase